MRSYLEDLGGKQYKDGTVHGNKWIASIEKRTIHLSGVLNVIELEVTITGFNSYTVMEDLFKKAQRAGG